MTRVHPQFLMDGMKKSKEKQDFTEFEKQLANGLEYWTNLFSTEIGKLDRDLQKSASRIWKDCRKFPWNGKQAGFCY